MSKTKKPTPYDPKLVAAQCDPLTLRLGCAAGCWKGENFKQCDFTETGAAPRRSPSAVGHATTGTTIANFYPRRASTDPRASCMPTMMSSRYRRC